MILLTERAESAFARDMVEVTVQVAYICLLIQESARNLNGSRGSREKLFIQNEINKEIKKAIKSIPII